MPFAGPPLDGAFVYPMDLPDPSPPNRPGPSLATQPAFGPPVPGVPWMYQPEKRRSLPTSSLRAGPTIAQVFQEGPSVPGSPWFKPGPVRFWSPTPQPIHNYPRPVFEGPAVPEAPWFRTDTGPRTGSPVAPDLPTPKYSPPAFSVGPPVSGAPWSAFARILFAPSNHPPGSTPPPPPPPVTPPGVVRTKNYVSRIINPDDRIRRFSERIADIMNSLMYQGILVQTGPNSWTLDVTNSAAGTGVSGTFP